MTSPEHSKSLKASANFVRMLAALIVLEELRALVCKWNFSETLDWWIESFYSQAQKVFWGKSIQINILFAEPLIISHNGFKTRSGTSVVSIGEEKARKLLREKPTGKCRKMLENVAREAKNCFFSYFNSAEWQNKLELHSDCFEALWIILPENPFPLLILV